MGYMGTDQSIHFEKEITNELCMTFTRVAFKEHFAKITKFPIAA